MRTVLALSLLCTLACAKKGPPPVLIGRLTISDAYLGDNGLAVGRGEFEDRLHEALERAGRYSALPPNQKPPAGTQLYRCRAEVILAHEREAAGDAGALRELEVGVAVQLHPMTSDANSLRAEATAQRLFAAEDHDARHLAIRGALAAALRSAAEDLLIQVDSAGKTDTALIADLDAKDARVRDCAVRQLADRRNPAAVPALIDRLKDSDRQVVLRAMGALEALRDRRAVKPLIELTEHQDPTFVAQVAYVIGSIGGSEAEAFLYTLQNGSTDPQVRVAAAEASAELKQQRDVRGEDSVDSGRPSGSEQAVGK
jgi:HEAT repeat protein